MVKAFTEQEKEWIEQELVVKGRELFGQFGLKKTSIKDLTEAVGIAQGSFYNFFGSKEELYFDILQKEEDVIRQGLLAKFFSADGDPQISRETLINFLKAGFVIIETNPLLKRIFVTDEYQRMLRKLPKEKLEEHFENDADVLVPLIIHLQEIGLIIHRKPEIIASAFRGIFTISLHKKEIGEEVYEETRDLLIELLVDGLMAE